MVGKIKRNLRGHKYLLLVILAGVAAYGVKRLGIQSNFMVLVVSAVAFYGIYGVGLVLIKDPFVWNMCRKFMKKNPRL